MSLSRRDLLEQRAAPEGADNRLCSDSSGLDSGQFQWLYRGGQQRPAAVKHGDRMSPLLFSPPEYSGPLQGK